MTQSPERRRRWFQIHLSTAVLLMLVCGALTWMSSGNGWHTMIEQDNSFYPTSEDGAIILDGSHLDNYCTLPTVRAFETRSYGWPVPFIDHQSVTLRAIRRNADGTFTPYDGLSAIRPQVLWLPLNEDLGVVLGILAFTVFLAEYFSRRRRAH